MDSQQRSLSGESMMLTCNLESRLNQLDVEAHKLESEELIERCFELGFLPWSNPKFLVFLHWYLQANLTNLRGGNRFMRGLICARHAASLMPPDLDPDIEQDIRDWANLQLSDRLGTLSSAWPAEPMSWGFGIRLRRHMDRRYMQLFRLRQKNIQRQERSA